MTKDFWTKVVNFAETITSQLGSRLLAKTGKVKPSDKTDGSWVTASDLWVEQKIRTAIVSTFPNHGFLSEETAQQFPDNEWCWIVDPIDGTSNFSQGLPLWSISLGLLYQGTPVFGYVHLPHLKQTFYGFYNSASCLTIPTGAFMNDQVIYPSSALPHQQHFFNFCLSSAPLQIAPFPCRIRVLGAATYDCLTVANGTALGAVEFKPKIWDIAATWAIVQAAGAVWIPLEPKPIFPLLAEQDYHSRCFPTLVVTRNELVPMFRPQVQKLLHCWQNSQRQLPN